jgi:SAM-dependent methyltransferase
MRASRIGEISPAPAGPQRAWAFSCPVCRTPLDALASRLAGRCPGDGSLYRWTDGIWRFLPPARADYFRQFMTEYASVRRAEGRGSDDSAYYQALPFKDLSGRFGGQWRIRARSFQTLVERVLAPLEAEHIQPLSILDLGAGNGWLSYRLSQRGHQVAAVDLLVDAFDGLGAFIHYDVAFTPIQAEFDRLPFDAGQADLVILNASLHYSTNYEVTLREALRVLRRDGCLAILDSPIYHDPSSGQQMVRERERQFEQKYGFASNALPSENYLTFERLDQLEAALGLHWEKVQPFYGWRPALRDWRWALRPWWARLRGSREPAQFLIVWGRR